MKIFKYPLNPQMHFLHLPRGAKLLSVQIQDNCPQVWALVDPNAPKEERRINIVPTGIEFDATNHIFVDTFQIDNFPAGTLVFHLFEVIS